MNESNFASVDRLAGRIINSLHGLLGVSYSDRFEHFVYHSSVNFAATSTKGDQQVTVIRISQEAAFFCTAIRVMTRTASSAASPGFAITYGQAAPGGTTVASDAGIPDPGVLIQITDGGNDRLLHSEAADAGLIYGTTGNSPHALAKPKLFKPNSAVTCTFTALKTNSVITTTRIALMGFKVYRGDGATTQTVRGY